LLGQALEVAIHLTGRVAAALWLWQQASPQAEPARDVNWLWRIWNDYINRPWVIGNFSISLASLVLGLTILLVALVVSRSVRTFLERRMVRRKHLDPGLQYTILRLVHYLVIAVGVLFAFRQAFNADLTTLAVLFTALSVGIGFGLQFIAGDIASGFILLFERPVRVGDFITITGPDSKVTEGRVTGINLRTSKVLTNEHITVIVPNSKLVNDNLINWSYGGRRSRLSIPIGVSYHSDLDFLTRPPPRSAEGGNHKIGRGHV